MNQNANNGYDLVVKIMYFYYRWNFLYCIFFFQCLYTLTIRNKQ